MDSLCVIRILLLLLLPLLVLCIAALELSKELLKAIHRELFRNVLGALLKLRGLEFHRGLDFFDFRDTSSLSGRRCLSRMLTPE